MCFFERLENLIGRCFRLDQNGIYPERSYAVDHWTVSEAGDGTRVLVLDDIAADTAATLDA